MENEKLVALKKILGDFVKEANEVADDKRLDELIAEVRALRAEAIALNAETRGEYSHVFLDADAPKSEGAASEKEAGPNDLFKLVVYDVRSIPFKHFDLPCSTTIAVDLMPFFGRPFDRCQLQLNLTKALSHSQSQLLADRLSLALLNTLLEWYPAPAA